MTYIMPKKDLYNVGKCFTSGKTYCIQQDITNVASLMEIKVVNDLNELHIIGSWWRNFKIVKPKYRIK